MAAVLLLHNLCAFLWLGCVLAEVTMEQGRVRGPIARRLLSLTHGRLDLFVELPAFLGLVLTGGSLAGLLPLSPMLAAKVAAGLLAVGANMCGVLMAGRPLEAAEVASWTRRKGGVSARGQLALSTTLVGLAIGAHVLLAR